MMQQQKGETLLGLRLIGCQDYVPPEGRRWSRRARSRAWSEMKISPHTPCPHPSNSSRRTVWELLLLVSSSFGRCFGRCLQSYIFSGFAKCFAPALPPSSVRTWSRLGEDELFLLLLTAGWLASWPAGLTRVRAERESLLIKKMFSMKARGLKPTPRRELLI